MDDYLRQRRLERRLKNSYTIIPETGCWIGRYATDSNGYCQISITNDGVETTRPLHIVMYEKEIGEIPYGNHLHHKCGIRKCCNPAHLQPVTPIEHRLLAETIKLSDDDIKKIKLLVSNGETHKQVAIVFGVSREHVTNIVNEKRRKYFK